MSNSDPLTEVALRRDDEERRLRGCRWTTLIDELVAIVAVECERCNRDELITMLAVADVVSQDALLMGTGGLWSEQEAQDLDDLDSALWKTVELLQRLQYPLARAIAGANNEMPAELFDAERRAEDDLYTLTEKLAGVGRAARSVPQRRRGRGQHMVRHGHGPAFDLKPLRPLMEIVAGYWKQTLNLPFRQNQRTDWDGTGPFRPSKTAGSAVRFSYAVIEYFAPGQGGALKTLAREYIGGYGE